MVNRWRCHNCGKDWKGLRVCERCNIDPQKEPRFAHLVVKIETIHFDPPHPTVKNAGVGTLACTPQVPVVGNRATGEPSVVNCEECRETEAWRKAYSGEPSFAGDDEVVTFTEDGCCG